MAKIEGGITSKASGKLGPVVVVQRDGKSYIRLAPQFSKNSWTPGQKQHRERFRKVNAFCQAYKRSVIFPIWNKIAEHKTGYNLFIKANMPAFGRDGELTDISLLHFSDGKLPVPFNSNGERVEGDLTKIKVNWQNDAMLPTKFNNDELMMMVAFPERFIGPAATGIKRSLQEGIVTLPGDPGNIKGIYLFFSNSERNSYSPDRYFPF